MDKPNEIKKSRMVRIVVSDETWADFKLLHRNRYASTALGDLVERDVVKGRRTSLDMNKAFIEKALNDAHDATAELSQLVQRLEAALSEEENVGKGWEQPGF